MPVIKSTATTQLLIRKKKIKAVKGKNKIIDTRKRSIRKTLNGKMKY